MANFDKITDETGQQWTELNGKLHRSRTLEPNEILTDPEAFKQRMLAAREDFRRIEHASWLATKDKVLR